MKKIFLGLLFIFLSQSVHARYFDPEGGRFINRDPLQYVDGMNLYAGYFAQRFQVDPSGLQSIPSAGFQLPDNIIQNTSIAPTPIINEVAPPTMFKCGAFRWLVKFKLPRKFQEAGYLHKK